MLLFYPYFVAREWYEFQWEAYQVYTDTQLYTHSLREDVQLHHALLEGIVCLHVHGSLHATDLTHVFVSDHHRIGKNQAIAISDYRHMTITLILLCINPL